MAGAARPHLRPSGTFYTANVRGRGEGWGVLVAKSDNVPFVEAQERIRIDIFMREIYRERP